MKVKDYYYSQEEFELLQDQKGIFKTNPIPKNINEYYNSENYISHKNEKTSFIEKSYSFVQNLNFNYKLKIINKYFQSGKLLDYGCGNGEFLNYLRKKSNFDLFGFEPNLDLKLENNKIYQNLENINGKFDIITLWHVFEHIENREEILQTLRLKLNPNGILLIAIPNHTSLDGKFYKNQWAAWDVPRHIYHYSKTGAIQYFTQNSHFYLNKIYPLPFDSFYISILSSKYKNSKIQQMLSPVIATLSNLKALFTNEWSSLIYILKNDK